MGRILAIRLSAVTYDEDAVFRAWPRLCELAWPGQGAAAGGAWRPTVLPKALAPPFSDTPSKRGVTELAAALRDEARFGSWPAARRTLLQPGLAVLERALADLETVLGDWQPQAANRASDGMEDALDDMERLLA